MQNTTILKEITAAFVEKVKEDEIIQDKDMFNRFELLLTDSETLTIEKLKQTLFN